MPNITRHEFDLLRDYISHHCGLQIGDEKDYLIECRLAQLMYETGSSTFHEFYLKAKEDPKGALRDRIIDAVTTHETSWFRDQRPWRILEEVILPDLLQAVRDGRKRNIRVWSVACSTGQEPYSVMMLVDNLLSTGPFKGLKPECVEIIGTDISPNVIFIATAGRYSQIEMSRGMDNGYLERFFTKDGTVWSLREPYRKRVAFKRFNLQESLTPLGKFDLILCRNVAIYFSDTFKRQLFSGLASASNPGAYLMLGASESLLQFSTPFVMREHKQAIFYQLK